MERLPTFAVLAALALFLALLAQGVAVRERTTPPPSVTCVCSATLVPAAPMVTP